MPNDPILISVVYDPGRLAVRWTASQPPGFTTYVVNVTEIASGQAQQFPSKNNFVNIKQTLDPSKEYSLVVAVMAGPTNVGNSSIVKLIGAPPESPILSGGDLFLSVLWSASRSQSVDGYIATLATGNGSQTSLSTDANNRQVAFPGALDPAEQYAVTVRAANTNGIVLGPATPPLAPIATAPSVISVVNTGMVVTVQWNAASSQNIDSYVASLIATGSSKTNVSTDKNTLIASFNQVLDSNKNYTLVVCGSDSVGSVFGPPSDSIVPIVGAPINLRVTSDGTHVSANWSAVSETAVTGYVAELLVGGQAIETKNVSTPNVTFDTSLNAGSACSVRVGASGVKALGPTSTAQGSVGSVLRYVFDELGRLASMNLNSSLTITYVHDDRGNILTENTTVQ